MLKTIYMLMLCAASIHAALHHTPDISESLGERVAWTPMPERFIHEVTRMVSGPDSAIWFGCQAGIIRYDGMDHQVFNRDDGLADIPVSGMLAAKNGAIYACTDNGIYRYEQGIWTQFNILLGQRQLQLGYRMAESSDGSIWIGTDYGMLRFHENTFTLYNNNQIHTFTKAMQSDSINAVISGLNRHFIYGILEDSKKNLWFCVRNSNLLCCSADTGDLGDPSTWTVFDEHDGLKPGWAGQIIEASDGRLFYFNRIGVGGISIMNPKTQTWRTVDLTDFGGLNSILTGIRISDGTLMFGCVNMLITYKDDAWHVYDVSEKALPSATEQILESSDGRLWFGGFTNKVFCLDYHRKYWRKFNALHFQCDTEGMHWFIHLDGGIVSHQTTTDRWMKYSMPDGLIATPLAIASVHHKQLIASGSHNDTTAIALFDGRTWRRHVFSGAGRSTGAHPVWQSPDSSFWIYTRKSLSPIANRALVHFRVDWRTMDLRDVRYVMYNEKPTTNPFEGIVQTGDGRLWCGGSGLFTVADTAITSLDRPDVISRGWIFDICVDRRDVLWVTGGWYGIHAFNGESWRHHTVADNLISNNCGTLFPLSDGSLLAGTERGISRFDQTSWTPLAFPQEITLPKESGTIRQSSNGAFWINRATRHWYTRAYRPEYENAEKHFYAWQYIPDRDAPSTIKITGARTLSGRDKPSFIWEGRDRWHHTPQHELQYSWRVNQRDWSPFSFQNDLTLNEIGNGEHLLEVRARDRDFNIEFQPASFTFYVEPPFWKRAWFITLILLVILLVGIFEYQIIHRDKRLLKLNRILSQRTEELRLSNSNLIKSNRERINRVLKIHQIEISKLKNSDIEPGLQIIYGDLAQFIRQIFEIFATQASARNITFTLDLAQRSLYTWYDEEKLEKIIYNLLSNAFKYTTKLGIITVSLQMDDKDKNMLIKVRDTGIGIPEKELNRIFDKDFQGSDDSRTEIFGAGIGLAFTKELVEQHFGDIIVQSEPGRGATFTIRIPVGDHFLYCHEQTENTLLPALVNEATANESQTGSSESEKTVFMEAHMHPEKPVILVVEDNEDLRKEIVNELEEKYYLSEAGNGEKGLKKALHIIPDLILTDIKMPGITGIDLCNRIKSDNKLSHIPVIMLSVGHSEEMKLQALKSGADDFISKPFSMEELKLRIRNMLRFCSNQRANFVRDSMFSTNDLATNQIDRVFLHKVQCTIQKKMTDSAFNVESLSRTMHMSRSNLFKKMRALTGYSPNEFIRIMRLKRARQLLETTDCKVTDIMMQVGYNDYKYFSKSFTQLFDKPPSKFSKKHLSG